jgi:hypothetical protein
LVGLIPKILLGFVESQAGSGAVDEIRRRAGVQPERTYRLHDSCDDGEWQRLLSATVEVLGISLEQALDLYAEYFLKDARRRFPMWFEMSHSARDFLRRQPAIHNTFASSVGGAEASREITDKFRVEISQDEVVTHYVSPNRLCRLYVALARAVLKEYGEQATITHDSCMHDGDEECLIRISWA